MAFLKESHCASFNTIKTKKKEDTLHYILVGKALLAHFLPQEIFCLCFDHLENLARERKRYEDWTDDQGLARKDRLYGRLADKLANQKRWHTMKNKFMQCCRNLAKSIGS